MRTGLTILALTLVLAACGTDRGSEGESDAPEAGGGPIGFAEALFPGTVEPAYDALVDAAVTDLAARLDVDAAGISVVSATAVTWPNAGLGCPEPDAMYAQALVKGALVELEHDGRVYRYHAGGPGSEPFLCDPPAAVPPVGGGAG